MLHLFSGLCVSDSPPIQVVLTGARSIADIEEGWRVIWLLIKQFVTKRQ